MASTNKEMTLEVRNILSEALSIAQAFQVGTAMNNDIRMAINVDHYGVDVSFTKPKPKAEFKCEHRKFDFSNYYQVDELKKELAKFKRFLKSKAVMGYTY